MRRTAAGILAAGMVLAACERRPDVPPAQPMEGEAEMAPLPPQPGVAPGVGGMTAPAGGHVVEMIDRQGQSVGGARIEQDGDGVRISIRVTGLTPNQEHGFHFHETGRCDPPSFESAGGHFNPTGHQHGFENPQGPHAGDLPNLRANAEGVADTTFTVTAISLTANVQNSIVDADGTALMVHARPDDYRTDPSGNSGDRIACGAVLGRQ
jgi:superoxide dismutase, Cu-Zn family